MESIYKNYKDKGLTEKEIDELKLTFDLFDKDNDGKISSYDLMKELKNPEYYNDLINKQNNLSNIDNPTLQNILFRLEQKNEERIDLNEFFEIMTETLYEDIPDKDLKEIYNIISDGNTEINKEQLIEILKEIHEPYDEKELENLLGRNGIITEQDFINVMKRRIKIT